MLCDICGKNPATVHLTEIVNEEMTELHLCETCAQAKSQQMEQQFGLSDLLAGMADFDKPVSGEETISSQCPNCKLTYTDFKKIGRLGCGECYTAFRKYLGPLLKRIHGSGEHAGKVPIKLAKTISRKKAGTEELRLKLQKAIETEAFEEAARIRDQIKELEKKQQDENAAE
ncbi:MAG: UvrB/UvrC motif-containing protein [Candidatus Omnitrophica bacterium]|jgi:protein arginine kinase activator|nr:UvrB/UvrC motif-containing protein [Candidatus Omnitrophota bacterium]